MNEQLVNLISYLENPIMVVFWVEGTIKGDIYHRLGKVEQTSDELKVFFLQKVQAEYFYPSFLFSLLFFLVSLF